MRQTAWLTVKIAGVAGAAPAIAGLIAALSGWSGVGAVLVILVGFVVGALAGQALMRRTLTPRVQEAEQSARAMESQRAAHEALLHDSTHRQARLRAIIDAMHDPVIAVARDETIVFANHAAGDFFQTESARLVGDTAQHAVTQSSLLGALRRGLRGERQTARLELSTRRGARIYDVTGAPIASGGESGAVLILRDVTDLARAARMKTDFVANASHELRTPVAAIRAALETARIAAPDDPATMMRFLDMAPAHLRRLEEMTGDLLDLSRLEQPDLQLTPRPLSRVEIEQTLTELFAAEALKQGVRIRFSLQPELEGFGTDRRLLLLILKNLVDNAVKFCNADSVVEVVGAALASPRRARFEVRDQGIGIPLNQQQRVFERFYQVDAAKLGQTAAAPARKGTGLGLSIVKHAVSALRGDVGIDSVYQQGTTVWFETPELSIE